MRELRCFAFSGGAFPHGSGPQGRHSSAQANGLGIDCTQFSRGLMGRDDMDRRWLNGYRAAFYEDAVFVMQGAPAVRTRNECASSAPRRLELR